MCILPSTGEYGIGPPRPQRNFLEGRGFVTPDDVKAIGAMVLRHRISVSYEAEAEELTSEDLVRSIFDHVEVP